MRRRYWLPIAVAIVILGTSLVPGSGGSGGAIGPIGVDKLLHAGGYAVLAIVALFTLRVRSVRTAILVVGLVTAFGGAVELLQGPVPGRYPSLLDLVADAVGAVLGVAAWWLFVRVRSESPG